MVALFSELTQLREQPQLWTAVHFSTRHLYAPKETKLSPVLTSWHQMATKVLPGRGILTWRDSLKQHDKLRKHSREFRFQEVLLGSINLAVLQECENVNAVLYFSRPPNSGTCPEVALLPCSTGMHLSLGRTAPAFGMPTVMSVQEAREVSPRQESCR